MEKSCSHKSTLAKIRQVTTKYISHSTEVRIIIFQSSDERKFLNLLGVITSDLKYRTQTEVFRPLEHKLVLFSLSALYNS